jgi:hypothetical protein
MKGESTRKVPVPVKTDEIYNPTELKEMHQDLTLCIDIVPCIRFRALIALDNRGANAILEAVDSIFRLYKKGDLISNVFIVIKSSNLFWPTFRRKCIFQ